MPFGAPLPSRYLRLARRLPVAGALLVRSRWTGCTRRRFEHATRHHLGAGRSWRPVEAGVCLWDGRGGIYTGDSSGERTVHMLCFHFRKIKGRGMERDTPSVLPSASKDSIPLDWPLSKVPVGSRVYRRRSGTSFGDSTARHLAPQPFEACVNENPSRTLYSLMQ